MPMNIYGDAVSVETIRRQRAARDYTRQPDGADSRCIERAEGLLSEVGICAYRAERGEIMLSVVQKVRRDSLAEPADT